MLKIKSPASVPEGTYPATFDGLEEKESKDGNAYLRWAFMVHTDSGDEEVGGMSSTNTGPKAKAYGWLAGLLGRRPFPDEDIDEDALIGTDCSVVIELNENGYSTIVQVLPPRRAVQPAQAGSAQAMVDRLAAQKSGYPDLDGLPIEIGEAS